tara:strand:- start:263 stop:472 length:210 start_codon:yes stop_codon:yes gene_type:complete
MRSMINIIAVDEATIIKLFHLFKLGFVHPENAPGTVKGLIIGFWRFEVQLILGFWDNIRNKEEEFTHHA